MTKHLTKKPFNPPLSCREQIALSDPTCADESHPRLKEALISIEKDCTSEPKKYLETNRTGAGGE